MPHAYLDQTPTQELQNGSTERRVDSGVRRPINVRPRADDLVVTVATRDRSSAQTMKSPSSAIGACPLASERVCSRVSAS